MLVFIEYSVGMMLIPVHLCSAENDTGALHSATVNWCLQSVCLFLSLAHYSFLLIVTKWFLFDWVYGKKNVKRAVSEAMS
jgi:hypothetical protein